MAVWTSYPDTAQAERWAHAHRYANLLRTAGQRRYAGRYLAWLRNGAVGIQPAREPGVTLIITHRITEAIDQMRLWED